MRAFLAVATAAVLVLVSLASPTLQEPEETPLQLGMQELNGAIRKVNRLVKDPGGLTEALEPIVAMQRGVITAKSEIPPKAAKLEGAAREELVLGYRRDLARVLAILAELELACLDGRAEDAQDLVQNLTDAKSSGHDTYQEKDG